MTTEIIVKKSFQEKMRDRIVDSIGELMDDEELSKLVERAVEEVFFTKREKYKHQTWGETSYDPPFLHEIIKEQLTNSVNKHVSDYIDKHPEEVLKTIKEVTTLGLGSAVMQAISNKFSIEMSTFQIDIENRLNGK